MITKKNFEKTLFAYYVSSILNSLIYLYIFFFSDSLLDPLHPNFGFIFETLAFIYIIFIIFYSFYVIRFNIKYKLGNMHNIFPGYRIVHFIILNVATYLLVKNVDIVFSVKVLSFANGYSFLIYIGEIIISFWILKTMFSKYLNSIAESITKHFS